jgi:hypothetical protein
MRRKKNFYTSGRRRERSVMERERPTSQIANDVVIQAGTEVCH